MSLFPTRESDASEPTDISDQEIAGMFDADVPEAPQSHETTQTPAEEIDELDDAEFLDEDEFSEVFEETSSAARAEAAPARDFTDDDDNDTSLFDMPADGEPVALPKPEKKAKEGPNTQTCPECGITQDWGMASWCPSCGFYPTLGVSAGEASTPDESGREAWEEESTFESLWDFVPPWAYSAVAGAGVIVAGAIAARVMLADNDSARFMITTIGALVSIFTLCCVHVLSYLYSAPVSDELKPTDLFMKPLLVWKGTFMHLPATANRVRIGIYCLTMLLCSLTIVAGFNYNAFFDDWGFRKRAQSNLVQEMVNQARQEQGEGEGSLEDGINDFVGEEQEPEPEVVEVRTERIPCLVIGYNLDQQGRLDNLVLAAKIGGKIKFVGYISAADIPDEERLDLEMNLPRFQASKSAVKAPVSATWLKPKFLVEVKYEKATQDGKLINPAFNERMEDAP